MQFIGSIGACARSGTSYTECSERLADLSAFTASPSARALNPGPEFAAFSSMARIAALSRCALPPGSHVIFKASRARSACQKCSATITTPPSVRMTLRTPGIASAATESSASTLPPSTGLCASAAYNSPGSLTSIPNSALPSTLLAESIRNRGLPMI